jgi:hypothetical protein
LNQLSAKLVSILIVLALLTTAIPLLTSTVAAEPSAGAGHDGRSLEDFDDYPEVPSFNIRDYNTAVSYFQGLASDSRYGITGDGSAEDPFVIEHRKFVGSFFAEVICFNWIFRDCVFTDLMQFQTDYSNFPVPTTLVIIENCTFFRGIAGCGINFESTGDYNRARDIIVSNNTVTYDGSGIGTPAINIKGTAYGRTVIQDNYVEGNIQVSSCAAWGTAIIRNNVVIQPGTHPSGLGKINAESLATSSEIYGNHAQYIYAYASSTAGQKIYIHDNIVDGAGSSYGTAGAIQVGGSGSYIYIYDNTILNSKRYAFTGGGNWYLNNNTFDTTILGISPKSAYANCENNTFINAWSGNPVIGLTYDKVVSDPEATVNWAYYPIAIPGTIKNALISADNGTTWAPADSFSSTVVDLGPDEKVYHFLLNVTDARDNIFIEKIDIARDLSAPDVTFLAPLEGKTLRTASLQVIYETEDLTGVTYAKMKLDDGPWVEGVDLSGHVFEGASRGLHTVTLYVEDVLGHGQEFSVNFVFRPMGEETTTVYGNIVIDGDTDMDYFAHFYGLQGTGAADDPYIINGLNLDCRGGVGITLIDTTRYVEIYDIEFFHGSVGVQLDNAVHVTVDGCIFHDDLDTGVDVVDGDDVNIVDSYFDALLGVIIDSCPTATVEGSMFVSGIGVDAAVSEGTLTITGNSFQDCDVGIDVTASGATPPTVLIVENDFDDTGTAMKLDVDVAMIGIGTNEISSSEVGILLNSTVASETDLMDNELSHCVDPFLYDLAPTYFQGNIFVLNDNNDMLWFTSPIDGFVTKNLNVSCIYSHDGVGGATFTTFEASNDMLVWTSANSTSHLFNLTKEGDNELYIRGYDSGGNSVIISITVVRDTTPPTVSVVLPQSSLVLRVDYLPFRWNAADANGIASAEVKLDDDVFVAAGAIDHHTLTGLTAGLHTVSVMVTDSLGLQAVATASFEVVLSGYSVSGPIVIVGDDSLIENATLLGWQGDGSSDDPYVIKEFKTSASITGTTLHVAFRDLVNAGNITLTNVQNIAIENVVMRNRTLTVDGFEHLIIDRLSIDDRTLAGTYAASANGWSQFVNTIANGEDLVMKNSKIFFVAPSSSRYLRDFLKVSDVVGATITDNTFTTGRTASRNPGYGERALNIQGTNILLDNNTLSYFAGGGMISSGIGVVLSNNTLSYCGMSNYNTWSTQPSGMFPALSVGGTSSVVYNNTLTHSGYTYSTTETVKGGPGLIVSGTATVTENKITDFQVNTFTGIGVVARTNVFTDCFIGMSGNATMTGNTITGTNGFVPTAGAVIEGNTITVTGNAFYSAFNAPQLSVLNFADNVMIKNNVITAKVALYIDDGNADLDTITNLKFQGNTVTVSVVAIRLVTAVLAASEISGNTFACTGSGIVFSYSGTAGNNVVFSSNTFSGVVGDSIIGIAKPSGAVTASTMVHLFFNSTILGLAATDCRVSADGTTWVTVSKDGWFLLDPNSFPEGAFNLRCQLNDNKGNTFVASVNIVYDSEAPVIDITSPTEGEKIPTIAGIPTTVTWTVTDQGTGHISSVRINMDNTGWTNVNIVSGTYEKTFSSLSDGTHIVVIEATDDQSHVSTATRTFVTDANAPVVTITSPANNAVIASDDVLVQFTATDTGSGVVKYEYKLDNGAWTAVTEKEHLFSDLSQGSHTISVRATDATNWKGTATITITVDTVAPAITITSPTANAVLGNGQVSIVFSADATRIDISVDNGVWATIPNQVYTTPLSDGPHTVALRAYDAVNNMNETSTVFVVDTAAPSVSISSPTNGASISASALDVHFAAGDASGVSSLVLNVDGTIIDVKGTTSHHLNALSQGTHVLNLTATDGAGKIAWQEISFTVDTIAPTLTITSPRANEALADGDVSILFDTDAARIEVSVDGGEWSTIPNEAYDLTLDDGTHIVAIRAYDTANNVNQTSRSFIVDTTAPSVSISSPTDDSVIAASALDVYFAAEDASGITSLVLTVDGTNINVKGTASYHLSALSQGAHVLNLTATDAAGNIAWQEISFTVDTVAPAITITSPAANAALDDGDVSVAFTATGATAVQISVDGGAWTTIPNQAYALSLSNGTHTVALRAYDAVGNVNQTSRSFTVDMAAPVVSLISPEDGSTVTRADVDAFFSVSDASNIATLTLSVDGGGAVDVKSVRTYHLNDLSDGTHTLVFHAVDALGNEASYSFDVVVSVPVTVSGRILDSDGNPLVGANVTIGSVSTTTDSQGRYTLQTVRGEKTMTVTADGMSAMTQSLDLSSEQSTVSMSMKSSSGGADSSALIIGIVAVIIVALLAAFLLFRRKGKA